MVFYKVNEYINLEYQWLQHMRDKVIHVMINCKLLPNIKYLNLNFMQTLYIWKAM